MKNYTNQMQRDAIGWSTDPIEQEKKYNITILSIEYSLHILCFPT